MIQPETQGKAAQPVCQRQGLKEQRQEQRLKREAEAPFYVILKDILRP